MLKKAHLVHYSTLQNENRINVHPPPLPEKIKLKTIFILMIKATSHLYHHQNPRLH